MSEELKQVHEALNEIKSVVNEKTKDIITKDKFDKISEDLIDLQEKAQKHEQEAVALKAALQAGGVSENKSGLNDDEKKHQDLMEGFIRSGSNDQELKAMGVYSGAQGGYTVPKLMTSQIIKRIFETSPIRAVANIQSISTDALEFFIDDNEIGTGWVSETETRAETSTADLGKKTIAVHEQYAEPRITQRLLDDSIFALESWLSEKVADKLARSENTAFMNGTGAGQPKGLLTYTAGSSVYNREQIEQVNLGAAAALTGDGLIELQSSLKEGYQSNAKWLMKRASYSALLKLMYTDNKFDALTASSINGAKLELLGQPIVLCDDMPTVAANALSVVYGDFRQAYSIVDRAGIQLLRDPFTAKPFTKFYFTKRVGGDVLNTEALKIGKIAV